MAEAERDGVIDAIAPPPPKERWRWLVYGACLLVLLGAGSLRDQRGGHRPLSWSELNVTANSDGSQTYQLRLRNPAARPFRVHKLESAHEGFTVESVEGLPATIGAFDGVDLTLRVRVACPSRYPPRVRVNGNKIMELPPAC